MTVENAGESQPGELEPDDQVGYYIDLWKKSVEVQQHFNDIGWRIRGLALTVATFALGAGAVAARDASFIGNVSLGAVIVLLGLLLWVAFYFVDRYWYHSLLKGAVKGGTEIEKEIQRHLPKAGVTAAISQASFQPIPRLLGLFSGGKPQHSDEKLARFYWIGGLVFALAIAGFQVAAFVDDGRTEEAPMEVRIIDDSKAGQR